VPLATGPAGARGLTWGHGCEDPAASSAEELAWVCLPHSAVKFHSVEQEVKNLQRQLHFCKVQGKLADIRQQIPSCSGKVKEGRTYREHNYTRLAPSTPSPSKLKAKAVRK